MSLYHPKNRYASVTAFYALHLPEFHMPFHSHSSCEIMYVTKGSCTVYTQEKEISLEPNQFLFLDSSLPHRLFIPDGQPCSLLNLEFLCGETPSSIDLHEIYGESPSFVKLLSQKPLLAFGTDSRDLGYALKDLITHLERTSKEKDQAYLIRLLFFRTLLELSRCLTEQNKITGAHYLKKACAYISSHLTDTIRIPELAAFTGIHKSYLQSLFSRHMNCTITDYVNQKRMEQAAFLLTNSSLCVTDVAFQTGYNSRQHFGCVFEKHYKVSPKTYRQLHGKALLPSTGTHQILLKEDGSRASTKL